MYKWMNMWVKVAFLVFFITFIAFASLAQKGKNGTSSKSELTKEQQDSLNTYVQIDRIFIVGNKKTKEKIIERELDIYEGQVLTKQLLSDYLEEDENKIFNTSLFNSVDISVIDLLNGEVDIIIRVTERWYFFPVPIFQLADRNFTEWWVNQNRDFSRVEYGLRLRHYNFRGMNEKADITAQFGYTKFYQLAYSFPYIDKQQKIGTSFAVNYSTNKNIAVRTIDHRLQFLDSEDVLRRKFQAASYLNLRPSFYNFHRFGIWYTTTNVADTVSEINSNYMNDGETNQKYLGFTYRFTRDLRDYRAYPLKGFYIQAEMNKYGLGLLDDLDIMALNGSVANYSKFGKKFFLASNVSFSATFPVSQPYNRFNGIGFGDDFIRGYEKYVIEGPQYILNNNSFKREIFSTVYDLGNFMPIREFSKLPIAMYLSVFYDQGYVSNYPNYELNNRFTDTYIYGAGVGLDIVTMYDAVFRWEYSINKAGETGFRLNIHAAF